jgi:hypothetical protein
VEISISLHHRHPRWPSLANPPSPSPLLFISLLAPSPSISPLLFTSLLSPPLLLAPAAATSWASGPAVRPMQRSCSCTSCTWPAAARQIPWTLQSEREGTCACVCVSPLFPISHTSSPLVHTQGLWPPRVGLQGSRVSAGRRRGCGPLPSPGAQHPKHAAQPPHHPQGHGGATQGG